MNKTRQWTMLTAVACLAVLAAGWFLAIKPQRSHAAALRTQTTSERASNAKLQSDINQLKQQQRDLPAQQKLLSQIATKVPDNPALPSLIRQLSAAADGAGVNLVSMAPGQPAAPAAAAPAAAPLNTIPVTLQVQGTYFNLEQFFSSVENLNRAMLVSGFTVASAGTAGAPSTGTSTSTAALPPGTLTASITASVFESPQAAPTATTTTVH